MLVVVCEAGAIFVPLFLSQNTISGFQIRSGAPPGPIIPVMSRFLLGLKAH